MDILCANSFLFQSQAASTYVHHSIPQQTADRVSGYGLGTRLGYGCCLDSYLIQTSPIRGPRLHFPAWGLGTRKVNGLGKGVLLQQPTFIITGQLQESALFQPMGNFAAVHGEPRRNSALVSINICQWGLIVRRCSQRPCYLLLF
jgi:hypothetical protein